MLKYEKQFIEFICHRKNFLFLFIVSGIGFLVRYSGRTFISDDMSHALLPWFDTIKQHGGGKSLSEQVGNYNILYQTLIALMTYFDIHAITQYKVLSCIFDYVLAIACALVVKNFTAKTNISCQKFCLIYAVVLILPEVFLNSAMWGQCDSIYTSFSILALLQLYKNKYISAFAFWGLSLAFKLQAIFILPFLIFYYFYKKKFTFIYFGISVAVFWSTGLIAYLQGRNLLEPFTIYLRQAEWNQKMWMNSISFWNLIGNDYSILAHAAICLVVMLFGICLYLILEGKIQIITPEEYIRLACWSVWTCYLFLPCMHERYTYMLNMLLLILTFISKKYLFYFIISTLLSNVTYGWYLYRNEGITTWEVILYLLAYFLFTVTITQAKDRKDEDVKSKADALI